MSPEEKELLNRSVSLAEDNNKMLRKMVRAQRWASIMRAVYWLFILGSAVAGYYVLQPYVDQATAAYKEVSDQFK
jgi:hypothetical protein